MDERTTHARTPVRTHARTHARMPARTRRCAQCDDEWSRSTYLWRSACYSRDIGCFRGRTDGHRGRPSTRWCRRWWQMQRVDERETTRTRCRAADPGYGARATTKSLLPAETYEHRRRGKRVSARLRVQICSREGVRGSTNHDTRETPAGNRSAERGAKNPFSRSFFLFLYLALIFFYPYPINWYQTCTNPLSNFQRVNFHDEVMRYALRSSFRCFRQLCCWQARTGSRPTFLVEGGNDSSLEKNMRIRVDVRRQSHKCCQPRPSPLRKNVERMHAWSHTKGRHNHGLRLYLGLLFGRIFFGFSRTRRQFSEGGPRNTKLASGATGIPTSSEWNSGRF